MARGGPAGQGLRGGPAGIDSVGDGVGDGKVLVSDDDTTADFLENKLIAGTNVTLTVQNPAGDEDIKIDVTAVAATAKHVWDYFADQGMIDSDGSDWPTSIVAPAAVDAIKNFMHTRELPDDAIQGFAVQFDIPTGATEVKIRIWSRGTGTAGPWVMLLRATNLPDAAAIPAFAATELMTAITEAATTNGNYTEEIKTFAAIGNLTAGERGVIQFTRDKAGQGGDTLPTSVFIYHIQLIFQTGGG